jgi:hypothetical protein
MNWNVSETEATHLRLAECARMSAGYIPLNQPTCCDLVELLDPIRCSGDQSPFGQQWEPPVDVKYVITKAAIKREVYPAIARKLDPFSASFA